MLNWIRWKLVSRALKKECPYSHIGDLEKEHFPVERYYPFLIDEEFETLPWYVHFNVLLHRWMKSDLPERMHDHPRWTMTIVLRGELIECTPWGKKRLKAGSIVIRSPKCIHRFDLVSEDAWTLFVVGRRVYDQNTYIVKAV